MDHMLDDTTCYAAITARDRRYDGQFITCVTSTGIYCRPSCPARTPSERNVVFVRTAAAAQDAGFRACRRCHPDATPGDPTWDIQADTIARAVRLVRSGTHTTPALASQLGYSERHLTRLFRDELGTTPGALARAERVSTAHTLLRDTALPVSDIAFAAGFSSIRTFNHAFSAATGRTPTAFRDAKGKPRAQAASSWPTDVTVTLAVRTPYDPSSMFGHLAATAVPGIETWWDGAYHRTWLAPHGPTLVSVKPTFTAGNVASLEVRVRCIDVRDVGQAISRCRWMVDADADPHTIHTALAHDHHLASSVTATPGRRIPRCLDGTEMALRVVIGQHISTRAAQTVTGSLVTKYGETLADHGIDDAGVPGITHLFPSPSALEGASREDLRMPSKRAATFTYMASLLASGELDVGRGAAWEDTRATLAAIPGVGPWTVEVIALRALGDPDAFPATDLGVVRGAEALGIPASGRAFAKHAATWQPWRGYAVQHLWAAHGHEINNYPDPLPGKATT